MNNKSTAKFASCGSSSATDVNRARDGRATEGRAREGLSHSTDNWLKRELESLYSEIEAAPLPDSLADLAAKLEEKLQLADSKQKKPEPK